MRCPRRQLLEPPLACRARPPSAPSPSPVGPSSQASTSSASVDSRISSRRALELGVDAPGRRTSTRRSRLRGIRSAEPMKYSRPRSPLPEAEDARVLEEAADDRAHADRLGQPGHAGPQAADAAHDRGRSAHARLRRRVQRVDHARVHEAVHLQRRCAPSGARGLAARISVETPSRSAAGATSSLPVVALAAVAGEVG